MGWVQIKSTYVSDQYVVKNPFLIVSLLENLAESPSLLTGTVVYRNLATFGNHDREKCASSTLQGCKRMCELHRLYLYHHSRKRSVIGSYSGCASTNFSSAVQRNGIISLACLLVVVLIFPERSQMSFP